MKHGAGERQDVGRRNNDHEDPDSWRNRRGMAGARNSVVVVFTRERPEDNGYVVLSSWLLHSTCVGESFFGWIFSPERGRRISRNSFSILRIGFAFVVASLFVAIIFVVASLFG